MLGEILDWFAMIEIPVFASLFSWLYKQHRDTENSIIGCRDALSDFKVHVARNYVSGETLKDTENRITAYLLRIERKIDMMENRK